MVLVDVEKRNSTAQTGKGNIEEKAAGSAPGLPNLQNTGIILEHGAEPVAHIKTEGSRLTPLISADAIAAPGINFEATDFVFLVGQILAPQREAQHPVADGDIIELH